EAIREALVRAISRMGWIVGGGERSSSRPPRACCVLRASTIRRPLGRRHADQDAVVPLLEVDHGFDEGAPEAMGGGATDDVVLHTRLHPLDVSPVDDVHY